MGPVQGYQDYRQQRASVEPAAVGQTLAGPPAALAPVDEAPVGGLEHSPESTELTLRNAVGLVLARKQNIPGRNTLTQLRQMGMPESELHINRLSGMVEGDE